MEPRPEDSSAIPPRPLAGAAPGGEPRRPDDAAPLLTATHWLTQRFADPGLEADFREEYAARSLRIVQGALVVGLLTYGAFGLLDLFIVPEALAVVWTIRFGVVLPVGAAILAWSFRPSFLRWIGLAGWATAFFAGLGIAAMVAAARGPGRSLYQPGLLLVIGFTYSFLRLRFLASAAAAWSFTVPALLLVALGPYGGLAEKLNSAFFLVGANVMGMGASWALERSVRQEYLQRRLASDQAGRLAEALGKVKVLSGLVPVCAWCRQVRRDDGYWQQLEAFVAERTDASFSHGICPRCLEKRELEDP